MREEPNKKKKEKRKELKSLNTVCDLGLVWYMCLKTVNCCLKIFMKIHVSKKIYKNT